MRRLVLTASILGRRFTSSTLAGQAGTNIKPKPVRARTDFKFVKLTDKPRPNHTISVLSYNILADCRTGPRQFPYCPDEFRQFSYRSPLIISDIKRLNCDIICLQEVDHYDDVYKDGLENELGYKTIYAKKVANNRVDGIVLGYKPERFELKFQQIIDFNENHPYTNKHDTEYAHGNNALIVILRDKVHNTDFGIVNTHFHWDPSVDHVKYLQALLLIRYLNKAFSQSMKVIFCGDLNSLPDSNIVAAIKNKGPLQDKVIDPRSYDIEHEMYANFFEKNSVPFESSYITYKKGCISEVEREIEEVAQTDEHPDFTNYTKNFKGTIDYMFYNKTNLIPLELLEIPKLQDVGGFVGFPAEGHPSDHFPLAVVFGFRNSTKTHVIQKDYQ